MDSMPPLMSARAAGCRVCVNELFCPCADVLLLWGHTDRAHGQTGCEKVCDADHYAPADADGGAHAMPALLVRSGSPLTGIRSDPKSQPCGRGTRHERIPLQVDACRPGLGSHSKGIYCCTGSLQGDPWSGGGSHSKGIRCRDIPLQGDPLSGYPTPKGSVVGISHSKGIRCRLRTSRPPGSPHPARLAASPRLASLTPPDSSGSW